MQQSEPAKLWAVLRNQKRKIEKELLFPCTPAAVLHEGLEAVCRQFDVAMPVVLQKHERELTAFSRTTFFARDFMEPFSFHALELELIFADKERKHT